MMDFTVLAQQCAPFVAPTTLAAIVKTESRFYPWAIGVNGGARLVRQPASKEEAIVTARWLLGKGYNIDLGLGQINVRNLAKSGLSIEDAFDDCKNLGAAAKILQTNYQSTLPSSASPQDALQVALSLYNTGSMTKGFANGYVHKVLGNAGVAAPGILRRAQTGQTRETPAPQTPSLLPFNVPVKLVVQPDLSSSSLHATDVYTTDRNEDILVYSHSR